MNNKKSSTVAIVTMFFLFAMVAFITNLAAPFGNIWGYKYSWAGMMGNMMNFAAYLFMGIPAGKMLTTVGYKKTSLIALGVGFVGLLVQYVSSIAGADVAVFNYGGQTVALNLIIYLLGAFISGFCVCMLNTVVNPMLNTLGGGGNKGNQLVQTGGSLNSLTATLTPFLVGVLVGTVNEGTSMNDVTPLLFIGMGVFLIAFLIISRVTVPEPALERARAEAASGQPKVKDKYSAWSFRHFVLGAVAIFFYVGIEVGIPGELNFYLSQPADKGGIGFEGSAAIAGTLVSVYWLLMLVGRVQRCDKRKGVHEDPDDLRVVPGHRAAARGHSSARQRDHGLQGRQCPREVSVHRALRYLHLDHVGRHLQPLRGRSRQVH